MFHNKTSNCATLRGAFPRKGAFAGFEQGILHSRLLTKERTLARSEPETLIHKKKK